MTCPHCGRAAGYHCDRERTLVGLAGAISYRRAYFYCRPCLTCGAAVVGNPRTSTDDVTEPDGTVDERACTNPDCPTNKSD